jgi:hypothetical protein
MAKSVSVAVGLVLVLAGQTAQAGPVLINLEWRAAAQTVHVGDGVNIGLYAVCDPGQPQLLRAADIVFTWDPAYLHLLGIDNGGAVPLMSSVLPANDPYHLNGPTLPPADGDGYYRAWANLGASLTVTEAGSLLTTFRFTALAQTPQTALSIAVSRGNPVLNTRILGSEEAGVVVTGRLGLADVTIVPEPTALGLLSAACLLYRRRR